MYRSTVVVVLIALAVCVVSVAWSDGHKSVGRAQLYSWIIPGAGQLYVGEGGRAAAFFGGCIVAAAIDDSGVLPLGVNVWAGFDAGKCANKHNDKLRNRGLAVAPIIDIRTQTVGLALATSF